MDRPPAQKNCAPSHRINTADELSSSSSSKLGGRSASKSKSIASSNIPAIPRSQVREMSQQQPAQRTRRARGVLALIASGDALPYYPFQPSSNLSVASSTASAATHRGRRRRRERHQQRLQGSIAGDLEGGRAAVESDADGTVIWQPTIYDHEASEFTLLYFADSTCRNCLRFNPILARFLRNVNGAGGDGGDSGVAAAAHNCCPGDGTGRISARPVNESTTGLPFNNRSQDQTTRKIVRCICVPNDTTEKGADALCQGLGVYCLPFNHKNRLALIR